MNQNLAIEHLFDSDTSVAVGSTVSVETENGLETIERTNGLLDKLNHLAQELNRLDDYEAPAARHNYPNNFQLSIVMPVYNEQATIGQVIARLLAIDIPKEVIVVDDGSTDGTREILEKLKEVPELRIILKEQNAGKGAAVRTGFNCASGDIVLVQDADLEYDPRDIPKLLEPILDGICDVVYGSRFLENRHRGSSFIHRFGNRLLTRFSNLTTGLRLTDMETCYKAFRRQVISDLPMRQNRFGFEPEVTAKIARRGYSVYELPIRYNARDWDAGKKIGMKDGFEALFCIFRYAWFD